MKKLYTYQAVDKFIAEKLAPAGYEIEEIPGALVDSYICIAPDAEHYNFIFREEYINEWSSGLSCRRYQKLPRWALDALASVEQEEAA